MFNCVGVYHTRLYVNEHNFVYIHVLLYRYGWNDISKNQSNIIKTINPEII